MSKNIEDFVATAINEDKKLNELTQKILEEMKALKGSDISFGKFLEETDGKLTSVQKWFDVLAETTNRFLTSQYPEDLAFFKASSFLSVFETGYLLLIDMVCLLLIKNGHRLLYRKKSCLSLEDVELVDTSIKLGFLKEHGFETLVRDDDRQLRNKIAHLSYTIKDKNMIIVDGKDAVNIHTKIMELTKFIVVVSFVLGKDLQHLYDN